MGRVDMSIFAPGKLAISICQRCGFKYPYSAMREDGNIPNLYVCTECYDEIDPYKLPPRSPDCFVLHHPRPDLPLFNTANSLLFPDGEQLLIPDTVTFVKP
jgi:hypothetical protein